MSTCLAPAVDAAPPVVAAARSAPVRVCYVIDNLDRAGTEQQLLLLIENLDRRFVEPHLCLLDGEGELSQSLEPEGGADLRLGVRRLRSWRAVRGARTLRRFLRERKIDVVQLHFPDSTYFGAPVAWWAGVSCIVRTRRNLGYWMTTGDRRLARLLGRITTATLTNSPACRDSVVADEGAAPERVHTIGNGVDVGRFADLPAWDAIDPPVVGVAANLRPVKNLDVFLRAAAEVALRHPRVRFQIAGEGPQRAALEQLSGELGLADRVAWLGAVDDVPAFLGRLAVAVLPSQTEGLSNSLLEYMAAGRPIVATRVGAAEDVLDGGACGLLVPPGEVSPLADAITRLLGEPALAGALAAAAQQRAREEYSVATMAQRHVAFYYQLLGRPVPGDATAAGRV